MAHQRDHGVVVHGDSYLLQSKHLYHNELGSQMRFFLPARRPMSACQSAPRLAVSVRQTPASSRHRLRNSEAEYALAKSQLSKPLTFILHFLRRSVAAPTIHKKWKGLDRKDMAQKKPTHQLKAPAAPRSSCWCH